MKIQKPKTKNNTIECFFGQLPIIIFAVLLFVCAAIKLAFTLSRSSATGIWKFVLIFDTISTLLVSASLFLFYMSSDTKSKEGTKISAISFVVASAVSVLTQLSVLIYYMERATNTDTATDMSASANILVTLMVVVFFLVQSVCLLYFSIRLLQDVCKKQITAKGSVVFAAAKFFTLIPVLIIRFVDFSLTLGSSTTSVMGMFKGAFVDSNAWDTAYPNIAFFAVITSSLTLSAFALLYNRFAITAKTDSDQN